MEQLSAQIVKAILLTKVRILSLVTHTHVISKHFSVQTQKGNFDTLEGNRSWLLQKAHKTKIFIYNCHIYKDYKTTIILLLRLLNLVTSPAIFKIITLCAVIWKSYFFHLVFYIIYIKCFNNRFYVSHQTKYTEGIINESKVFQITFLIKWQNIDEIMFHCHSE